MEIKQKGYGSGFNDGVQFERERANAEPHTDQPNTTMETTMETKHPEMVTHLMTASDFRSLMIQVCCDYGAGAITDKWQEGFMTVLTTDGLFTATRTRQALKHRTSDSDTWEVIFPLSIAIDMQNEGTIT
jgi:hypothetical protein